MRKCEFVALFLYNEKKVREWGEVNKWSTLFVWKHNGLAWFLIGLDWNFTSTHSGFEIKT